MKDERVFLVVCLFIASGLVLFGCGLSNNGVHILPTPTDGPQPAVTPPATYVFTPYPDPTVTASPSPTLPVGVTIFPSPTQEDLTSILSMTPGIIEITALPVTPRPGEKVIDVIGVFTPTTDMNVRSCAAAVKECYTGKSLLAGQGVQFYTMVTIYPSGDIWLCLDSLPDNAGGLTSQCRELVAYYLGGKKYGSLEIVVPAGG